MIVTSSVNIWIPIKHPPVRKVIRNDKQPTSDAAIRCIISYDNEQQNDIPEEYNSELRTGTLGTIVDTFA